MASFSKLPREIIIEVWRYVQDPEAIESFALTSKTIYSLGSSFIEEYNNLSHTFSSFYSSDVDCSIPAEILRTVLLNPRAALYVQDIQTMELFRKAVKGSPFVPKDKVESWINELVGGDEGAVLSLIVMRLPNVKSFNIQCMGENEIHLFTTLLRIAESQETDVLSQLRDVEIHRLPRATSGWVQAFLALPSVKMIHIVGDYSENDWGLNGFQAMSQYPRATLPSKPSAVTRLTLSHCEITTETLQGLQALEQFHYVGPASSRELIEPQKMISVLLANAKHSLQTLRLTRLKKHISGTINFADFKVLKELDIKSDLLLPYKDTIERSQLADLLPRSIEKIYLRRLHTDVAHSVEDHVIGIVARKAERLANLKKLAIELIPSNNASNLQLISEMKHKCEDVGIELTMTVDFVASSMRSSYFVPWTQW